MVGVILPISARAGKRGEAYITSWLAQDGVALMDLRTEEAQVADVLKEKFAAYMKEYGIDGARVDASKHMTKEFQHALCTGANTFCIGEVFDDVSDLFPPHYDCA